MRAGRDRPKRPRGIGKRITRNFPHSRKRLIDQPWKIMSIARRDWAAAGHSI